MTGQFDGKVSLVTGGSSGIGRAAALAFSREGAKVLVADVLADGGEESVRMIKEAGGQAAFILTFLALASKRGFVVTSYTDEATGNLGKNEAGRTAITKIELHPSVIFSHDKAPTQVEFGRLQQRAHEACFIANSLADCVKVIIIAHFAV